MKLKKLYSSREVAHLTGLTARQLEWWARRKLFPPSVPSHKTEAGGYTERRYSPIDLLELMVLADLRRKGFTLHRIRRLLQTLKTRFSMRLYDAIEGGGPVTLFLGPSAGSGSPRAKSKGDGHDIYARTTGGDLYNLLDNAAQPLLMVGEGVRLRELTVKESPGRRRAKGGAPRPPGRRPPA